jgi:protein involved in polysaccharide export with SLBB domain
MTRIRTICLALSALLLQASLASAEEPPPPLAAPQASVASAPLTDPSAAASEIVRLRIGDIVTLSLPGEDTLNKEFSIDRKGQAQIPEVGNVALAGLTIEEARAKVKTALGRILRDVERFDLSLKERHLLVTVLGYAKSPGPVELPGDATVQQAINAAGGLAQGAQLDRIQVRRGKEIVTFDYKKYLDTGDKAVLPTLSPLDEIFIPASPLIGKVQVDFDAHTLAASGDGGDERTTIKVFGEVNTPGSYAYKPDSTVIDFLMRAGGVSRFASVEQIRVIYQGEPQLFNLKDYLDNGGKNMLPKFGPGATVFVPKEIEEVKAGAHTVYVMGEVFKPGAFETKPGASFMDVFANAGGPSRFAETRQIRILRANGTVERFDLQSYTEAKGQGIVPPRVNAGDSIFVPEKTDVTENSWLKVGADRAVRVLGAVHSPGRYEWSDEMSILDLLAHAGGPTEHGDSAHIQILATDAGGNATPVLFDLDKLLKEGGRLDELPTIHAGYTITVPQLPLDPKDNKSTWVTQSSERSIYVLGALRAPGRYAFNSGLHFLDILSAADGPAPSADLDNIRITHRSATGGQTHTTALNLTRYFETGDEHLLPHVEPGDVIYIPERGGSWLSESKETTVRVLGSVQKPGRYRFDDTMSILDLLAEAGGPNGDAYQEKIVVVNFSTGQDQARVFNLVDFAKSGNFSDLPVVRAGDTVYVPNVSQSDWRIFMDGVRDAVALLSIVSLAGKL